MGKHVDTTKVCISTLTMKNEPKLVFGKAEFFQSIDLSHNPNLHSLTITDIFFESPHSTQFIPILRLLEKIGSAVAELSFEVTITQLTHLNQVPWDLLRDVVEEQCAQLGKMTIVLSVLGQISRRRKKLTEEGKQKMEAIVRGRCGHGASIEQKMIVDFSEQRRKGRFLAVC